MGAVEIKIMTIIYAQLVRINCFMQLSMDATKIAGSFMLSV